ncbi:YeeE/YedE family protein [Legionella worsleiensis]|uniref:Transmembrane protein n=1 Tax=Legionella worsleiensis TaxID=45076 RepID=A0A0W1AH42_9GAMM|nr:YeeE/YedE thiosulfate transporter family protein [Legionella worsleiensis]KTD80679.1 transmembrane protein [Legionella worsleiensis]STY32743.1 transmembrane protein [Legionella worsleiensis]
MNSELKVILGGVLLGLAAGMMLLLRGQILGCSGKLFRSWDFSNRTINYDNALFIFGLILSGVIFNIVEQIPNPLALFKINSWMLFFGGVLVGGGTYLANGCTSGHGLCGMSLLRKRSFTAVALFFPSAIITAWLVH